MNDICNVMTFELEQNSLCQNGSVFFDFDKSSLMPTIFPEVAAVNHTEGAVIVSNQTQEIVTANQTDEVAVVDQTEEVGVVNQTEVGIVDQSEKKPSEDTMGPDSHNEFVNGNTNASEK